MLKKCLLVLLIGEYGFIFGILLNYDNAWMHPEKILTHAWFLNNGRSLQGEDLKRGVNLGIIELGAPRLTRPFSNLFELVNAKFRAWLWQFLPPHPSFSLCWPLSFFLVPWLLYGFFRNIGCHADIAVGGVCLYLASIGFLGPLIMLFHPGKNFVNIFAVLALALAAALHKQLPHAPNGRIIVRYLALYLIIFLSFFWDETGVFIYVLIFGLFAPTLFFAPHRKIIYAVRIAYLLLPVGYYVAIHDLFPFLYVKLGYPPLNLQDYLAFPTFTDLLLPDWRNLFTNIQWQFSDHLPLTTDILARYSTTILRLLAIAIWLAFLVIVGLSVAAGVTYVRMRRQNRAESDIIRRPGCALASALVLLFGYSYFHTFALSHQVKVWGVWWYGNLFSLIFVIFLTSVFQVIHGCFSRRCVRGIIALSVAIWVSHSLVFSMYRNNIMKIENLAHTIWPTDVWATLNQYTYYDFTDSYACHITKFRYALRFWRDRQLPQGEFAAETLAKCPFLSYHLASLKAELPATWPDRSARPQPSVLPEYLRYADVNGNGKADLIYIDPLRTQRVWVGLSTGTAFSELRAWGQYEGSSPDDLQFADVNGDGKADALYFDTMRDNTVWVSLSTGTRFAERSAGINYHDSLPGQIAYVDLNHDAQTDALYFDTLHTRWILVALSNGSTFVPAGRWFQFSHDPWLNSIIFSVPEQMQYADINGDGQIEGMYCDPFRTHRLWASLSHQQYPQEVAATPSFLYLPEQLRYADVTGDGQAELLYLDLVKHPGVWVSTFSGAQFTQPHQWLQLDKISPEQIRYADVNGDGKADAVYADRANNHIQVSLSTGTALASPEVWGTIALPY